MQLKHTFLFIFLFTGLIAFSQVKVGQWNDHLSYNSANSVAKVGPTVYVSNYSGLAKYNVLEGVIEKYTKIDGLSDVGVQMLRKNDHNNVLMVIYKNTNIDVIRPDGSLINISDIKRKVIQGKKYINDVYFNGNLAYISCGFGIVVFDTDKLEIKDTYYLGNGVTNLEVYQVTKNDTAFFAGTSSGVYYGNKNSNLSNFQNWQSLNTGLTAGPYNCVVNFDGKILANYSQYLKTGAANQDIIYQYDGASWSVYPYRTGGTNMTIYAYPQYNKILIKDLGWIIDFSNTGVSTVNLNSYGFDYSIINDVYFENNGIYWLADERYGLIRSQGSYPYPNDIISIEGPFNSYVNDIDLQDGTLAVAGVNLGDTYTNQYSQLKPSVYQDQQWYSYATIIPANIKDINCVSVDPNDKTHVIFGYLGNGGGLVETRNNQLATIYDQGNSPIVGYVGGPDIRVTGVNFDKNSNLWASITLGKKCVSVLRPNNTWALLDFEQFVVQPTVTKIIFDKYDQAWIVLARNGGMMVYKDVNGLSQPNSSNTKLVNVSPGSGALPANEVRSVCEDKDGHIWVGTSKGITVFYNPENVFSGSGWDSQQILIEQDGHVQILLENDIITAISVDGANRKWVGTESSGVYCFSADGQEQVYHFTTDNSPLYSDLIRDIALDEKTGDVFIATEDGIQSYRTDIIKGFDDFEKVHAYPNPVRPGFAGSAYITGLIDEAVVKITDVNGNLVYQTKSLGGQVEWNLRNFNGARVTSGVYMIYCSSANGDKSATSKILVIN
jgi:hypothetical protein